MKTTQEQIDEVKIKITTNERDIDMLFAKLNQEVAENGVGSMGTTMQLEIAQDISDRLSEQLAILIHRGAKEVQTMIENRRNKE